MNDILDALVVYNPKNNKIRLGSSGNGNGDGGYVIIDGYEYDYYIGCGIGYSTQFDFEFSQKYPNITGLAFDGEIKHYPNLPSNIKFISKNISTNNTNHETNLNHEMQNFNNIFMKMDIEAHEWNWIKSFNHFDKIKQFVIEIHGLFDGDTSDGSWSNIGKYKPEDIKSCLEIINQTHHLIHFHANDNGKYEFFDGKEFPTVAELTYIRKKDCLIEGLNKTPFPITGLDYSNGRERHILELSKYPFTSL
jgi:hypothetical protein